MTEQNQQETNWKSTDPEYLKVEDIPKGDFIEGIYLEPVANQFDANKPNYKLDLGSKIVIVNTCGALAKKMADVRPGSRIRIKYEGKDVLKDGKFKGKDFHKVSVLVAT